MHQPPQSTWQVQVGLAAEAQRRQALLAQDWPALEAMFADALVYVHSTAARDTKTSLLHKLQSGQIRYRLLVFEDLQAHAVGDAVLVTGRMLAEIEKEGQTRQVRSLFMTVWHCRTSHEGRAHCQLVAHQGTPLPP